MEGDELDLEKYIEGVRGGDRALLARAITLVESRRPHHRTLAAELLTRLLPHTGGATRVGITGAPGSGKSTFIDTLGSNLTRQGHRVAVLAVDPSSQVTGGSILADKTRMERLGADERAFVRPSPSAGTLGGVASRTREALLLCEAAGFDVVLVETVGVGQSETVVADMTDFFLLLLIPGAGDELQGIKKGVVEHTDLIAVNKADGEQEAAADRAAQQYASALHLVRPDEEWTPRVLTCSALENRGLEEIWQAIGDHHQQLTRSGKLEARRREQGLAWLRTLVEEGVLDAYRVRPAFRTAWNDAEAEVRAGSLPPTLAARRVLSALGFED